MDAFDIAKIIIAKIFFTKASIDDIRTTEIRDLEVYFFIFLLVLMNIFQFLYYNDLKIFQNLLLNIVIFGTFGFLLYFLGQWGLGDSFLLLSLGLINIFKNFLEIFNWLLITFSIGIIFIFLFSIFYTVIFRTYKKLNLISKFSMFLSLFLLIISLYFIIKRILFGFLISLLFFIYVSIPFLKNVKNFMIKRVSIDKLKEGDVLLYFKVWRGITKKEIKELKNKKVKYVYVKEGVRYAPTFLFTLILIIFEKFFELTFFEFFPQEIFLI